MWRPWPCCWYIDPLAEHDEPTNTTTTISKMNTPNPPKKSTARALWAAFAIFIVYGTTFPFHFWGRNYAFRQLLHRINWHPVSSVPDVVQNILLFMPFGFLGYFSLVHKRSPLKKTAVVILGFLLSTSVEFSQIFETDRWPALSDVIFNTVGTAVGLIGGVMLKRSVLGFKSNPMARKYLDAPSAFPLLIFIILVTGSLWQPFDFSLEVSNIWGHVKQFLKEPLRFTRPDDDVLSALQFALVSLFACRLFRETGWRRPVVVGTVLTAYLGVSLEATQVIIVSRGPEIQDALVSWVGAFAGGVAFLLPGFRRRPWASGAAVVLLVAVFAGVSGLSPFIFHAGRADFNWIPFLADYEKTTAVALGNFLVSGMTYFPLGFLTCYLFPRSRAAGFTAVGIAASLSFAIEWLQGYVAGRYSDITTVIGACLGCLAGILVLTRGWPAFMDYMRQDEDTEV